MAGASAPLPPAPPPAAPFDVDDATRRMGELRPLATTMRLINVALCILVVVSYTGRIQPWFYPLAAVFTAWAAFNLWRDVTGRRAGSPPAGFVFMVLAIVATVRAIEHGALLLTLLVVPMVMLTLLHGFRRGMAAGLLAAAGLLVVPSPLGMDMQMLLPALGTLLIAPIAALLARPVAVLRQRIQLAAELAQTLDPRRGVQAVGLAIAERLRATTGAQQVIFCHRQAELPTVLVSDQDGGAYPAMPALARPILEALAPLPVSAAELGPQASHLQPLAQLLGAHHLQLVPDNPGDAASGWWLVAYPPPASRLARRWPLLTLAAFAVDMRRLVQQADYVDSLQAEIAAHERARIGRDLHDSALQPYLGLKFAIDVVAQRCTPDNPLHAPVQDLRQFCETELNELRDTVALLRNGEVRGDNTLVPALRRQARRFGALFGIQIMLQVPDELVTSRALSGAVLHMVNEAVNNARRHTQARQVWVSLQAESDALHLRVRDDAGQRDGRPAADFAPRSLDERARELGGTLTVHRPNGLDTEVHITIPI